MSPGHVNVPGMPELRLAEAALAVLTAAAGISPSTRHFQIRYAVDDSEETMSRSQAVAYLAALAKPVRCESRLRDSLVELSCEYVSNSRFAAFIRRQARDNAEYVRSRSKLSSLDRSVLFRVGSGSFQLGLDEFHRLEEEYYLASVAWSLTRNRNDSSPSAPGWTLVVDVRGKA